RESPGAAAGRRLRSSRPAVSAFPEVAVGSACTSTFSELARRSLALRPAHSRRHLYVTSYTEGFSHFVTSMTAPVASGWSVRRVGLAPTGKRRLLTAHANSGHSPTTYKPVRATSLARSPSNKQSRRFRAVFVLCWMMPGGWAMSETRKIAAILVSDVVGYSRLAGADEDRTLARLRALRSDLIDPTISVHHGRIVKRTGDGSVIEFRSVVDAVRCALEVQHAMVERNAGVAPEKRIEFRMGIHVGDVVEESDGDLMGDGVNIAARLEGIAAPGAICLSEDAYRQVKGRLDLAVTDLGPTQLKNIAEPVRAYSLQVGKPAQSKPAAIPASE